MAFLLKEVVIFFATCHRTIVKNVSYLFFERPLPIANQIFYPMKKSAAKIKLIFGLTKFFIGKNEEKMQLFPYFATMPIKYPLRPLQTIYHLDLLRWYRTNRLQAPE